MSDHSFDRHIKNLLRNYKTRVPAGLWNKISLEVKNELFDEHVKDALNEHQSTVPKGLWDKIEAEQKKERRPVAWWQNTGILAGIAALLLLFAGGGYYWLHTTKEIAPATNVYNNSNYNKQAKGQSTTAAASNSNSIDHKERSASVPTTIASSPSAASSSSLSAQESVSLLPGKSALTAGTRLSKKHGVRNGRQSSDDNDITTTQNSLTATQHAQVEDYNNNQPDQYDSAGRHITTDTYTTIYKPWFSRQQVVTPFTRLGNDQLTSIQRLMGTNSFSLACPNAFRPTWFVEIYGSPDYTTQRVHATSASNTYLKRKDSTEMMEGGFTFGARFARKINEHWLIKAGLQYTQVNQRFSIRTENEIKTTTVITTRAMVRNPGDTALISDTSVLTQIGYRLRSTQNHYKSVEIPLIASYETGNSKWRLGINGGVIINAISMYSGEILDTAYNVVPLSAKSTNGVYRSAVNLSAYLGVSIIHRISSDMEIFAEPHFRYGLSSSSVSNLGYSQSFNAAGLSLGIRYQLNNKGSKYSR